MAYNYMQNNVLMTMMLSKDLPDEQKRNNFLSAYMLGDAPNGFLAQMVNIRQQEELNSKIESLEVGKNSSIAKADIFIVDTVAAFMTQGQTRHEDDSKTGSNQSTTPMGNTSGTSPNSAASGVNNSTGVGSSSSTSSGSGVSNGDTSKTTSLNEDLEKISSIIAPFVITYVKKVHNSYLPVTFQTLNKLVLEKVKMDVEIKSSF
jgi:hypothetical protein